MSGAGRQLAGIINYISIIIVIINTKNNHPHLPETQPPDGQRPIRWFPDSRSVRLDELQLWAADNSRIPNPISGRRWTAAIRKTNDQDDDDHHHQGTNDDDHHQGANDDHHRGANVDDHHGANVDHFVILNPTKHRSVMCFLLVPQIYKYIVQKCCISIYNIFIFLNSLVGILKCCSWGPLAIRTGRASTTLTTKIIHKNYF